LPDIIDTATLFKFQNIPRDENLVFVLMPFQQKYFDLFEKIIKPVATEKILTVLRQMIPKQTTL